MPSTEQRQKYIEVQKYALKVKTNMIIRKIKEERFEIEDNAKQYSQAFYNDEDIPLGVAVTVLTRSKIHKISYDILKKIRNYEDDCDLSRLKRLISIHKNQLLKLKPDEYKANIKFYNDMYSAINTNLSWLKILNRSQ